MKERPILFSAPMIRALLGGTKTQTRRVVKPQPKVELFPFIGKDNRPTGEFAFVDFPRVVSKHIACPYGVPGDRLYAKEATWIWCEKRPNGTTKTGRPKFRYVPVGQHVAYCADKPKPTTPVDNNPCHLWKYKTARFMPRWASRITLEITDVRVQRVQEITEEDARAEGVAPHELKGIEIGFAQAMGLKHQPYRTTFANLWNEINQKRSYGWSANPWCWCLTFNRVEATR